MEKGFPVRHPASVWRKVEGEAFVVQPKERALHHLDEVATRVWELCDGRLSLEEMAEKISAEYEVSREQAQMDLMEFLEECERDLLVEIRSQPAEDEPASL